MQKKQAGFTLIEMLVVLGIFGLVMTGILEFLTSFLNMRFNAQARQAMSTQGNYAIDRIDLILRNGVTIPNICTTANLKKTFHKFETNLEGNDSSILMKKATVELTDDKIKVQQGDAAATELTTNATGKMKLTVTQLDFTCDKDEFTGGLVVTTKMTMQIARQSTGAEEKTISQSFTKKTALRNQADYQ
ncbi:MAG: type II secretion system protein [bacterium]|nr:type II secretion system protein [bacterium]